MTGPAGAKEEHPPVDADRVHEVGVGRVGRRQRNGHPLAARARRVVEDQRRGVHLSEAQGRRRSTSRDSEDEPGDSTDKAVCASTCEHMNESIQSLQAGGGGVVIRTRL